MRYAHTTNVTALTSAETNKLPLSARLIVPGLWGVSLALAYVSEKFEVGWLRILLFNGVFAMVACMGLELAFPYRADWNYPFRANLKAALAELARDVLFLIPLRFCVLFCMYFLTPSISPIFYELGRKIGVGTIMAHAPLPLRLALSLVLSEVFLYWFHRGLHGIPLMWRLHFTHHQPLMLTAAKSSRSHPFELVALYSLSAALSSLFAGSASDTQWLLLIQVTANTLAHANINVDCGRIYRAIFTGPELHRIHHSADMADLSNFSCTIPVVDRIFGTLRTKPSREPMEVGVVPLRPRSLKEQLIDPLYKPTSEL